jgi:hypothetical protein
VAEAGHVECRAAARHDDEVSRKEMSRVLCKREGRCLNSSVC